MASTKRRYSKEQFARRGDALVESKVRPHLTAADEDKFFAIETGEYELDKNKMKATDRAARPDCSTASVKTAFAPSTLMTIGSGASSSCTTSGVIDLRR